MDYGSFISQFSSKECPIDLKNPKKISKLIAEEHNESPYVD
jgi:hypothetical protein